jgi:hypothetical protein
MPERSQNQAHEGEEWNGKQGVVLHDAKHAERQTLQEGGLNHTQFNTHKTKEQAASSQGE